MNNAVVMRGEVRDRVFDILLKVEQMTSYFSYHDKYELDKSLLTFWIDDLEKLWHELDKAGVNDYDNLFHEMNEYDNEQYAIPFN